MKLGQRRARGRSSTMIAAFALAAGAMPALAFQPVMPAELPLTHTRATTNELDRLVSAGHVQLASVTTGCGWDNVVPRAKWHLYGHDARKLPVHPVWNGSQHWTRVLDSSIFLDPELAARAAIGYVEIRDIYSPFKDVDFAIGLVRNPKDGALSAMVFTMGVSARH